MLVAAAAVVVLLVAVAARKSGGGVQETPPPQTQTQTDPPGAGEGSSPDDLLALMGGGQAGLVALGAAAFSAAGGALGGAITDDDAGRFAGAINPIAGNAFNVGREVGEQLDKQIGGDGGGLTGTFAQVSIGGSFALAVILGPLFLLFALTIGFNIVLLYLIGSAISDLSRLGYGQEGARKDYDAEWARIHGLIYTELRTPKKRPDGTTVELTDKQAIRISYPYADGFMLEQNRIAFRQWMRRGRGLLGLGTTTPAYHARYGQDRGYFVGQVAGDALNVEPEWKTLSPDYMKAAEFAPGELTTVKRMLFDGYTSEWVDKSVGGSCSIMRSQGKNATTHPEYMLYRVQCQELVKVPKYKEVEVLSDPVRLSCMAFGAHHANVAAYAKWMAESRGAFVGDEKHAQFGVDEGRFTGSVIPGGGGNVKVKAARVLDEDPRVHYFEDEVLDWKLLLEKAKGA